MGTKGKRVSDDTLALNNVRYLWCRIPIEDGKASTPTLAPEQLEALTPAERDRFEKRMDMLASMASEVVLSNDSDKDKTQAISRAEAELRRDGTDVVFGKV